MGVVSGVGMGVVSGVVMGVVSGVVEERGAVEPASWYRAFVVTMGVVDWRCRLVQVELD